MNKTVLHCKDIVKTYGEGESAVFALQGVTLDVYRGEMMMLVGPSGCGKTTFVSCVSGLLDFDSGVCDILGKDIASMDMEEVVAFRGRHIGFVFQAFNLLPALTCVENVALPLTIANADKEQSYSKAKALLDAVGLGEKYDSKPKHLSGGEQQRVAVARALVHEPDLVICDEPTSSLDHQTGQAVMQLLQKMKNETHITIIVVTHDNRIYQYGDRMAHMEDGEIRKVEQLG